MPIADVFGSNIFQVATLTEAINAVPYKPARIGQMGLFESRPVRTTQVVIERYDGRLALLPTQPRGAPSTLATRGMRVARSFTVPHIPYDDQILAADVQNVRAFGSETEMDTVETLVNQQLAEMRQSHEATHEWHRIGAIKGQILDADGVTVLYDLYTEFGVSASSVNMALNVGSTKTRNKTLEVKRTIENALGAATYDHIHVLCSGGFFDDLISHADVKEAFNRWQDGAFLRDDPRAGFPYANVVFEEYRGKVSGQDFIADGMAYAFPVGVPGLFVSAFAPADFMETANTMGQPIYAKSEPLRLNRGVEIHTESNALMLCTRPECVVQLTAESAATT